MTPDQFLARCPQLWHVAPAGAWDTIEASGLRTAEQLITGADIDEETRAGLLTTPRPSEVRLTVEGQEVVLRDQDPLLRSPIDHLLDDGTEMEDWVRMLNRRAYLFTDKAARDKMIDKCLERGEAQDVLTFSPLRLLEAVRTRIELSAQNASAVARRSDARKGRDTFLSITRFANRKPAEVTVIDGVSDLGGIVMRVERHEAGKAPISIR